MTGSDRPTFAKSAVISSSETTVAEDDEFGKDPLNVA